MNRSRAALHLSALVLAMASTGLALAQSTTGEVPAQPALRTLLVGPPGAVPGTATGVVLQALPAGVDAEELAARLAPLIGQPVAPAAIESVVAEVNRRLAAAGFYVASVPRQDVSGGLVRIEIWQGRLADVRVEGPAEVAARAPSLAALRAGTVVSPAALDHDMAWLEKSLPGRRAAARFSPGARPGDMDVQVQISEPPRHSVTAGFDNSGTFTTGEHRLTLGLQGNQMLAVDDQLSYRLSVDPDLRHSTSHALSWTLPLAARHLLTVSLNASRLKGRLPAPFDLTGRSEGASVRYEVPLRLTGAWTDSLFASFDYKRSDNNLLFSDTPVNDTVTELGQFTLGYQAAAQDAWGQTRGQVRATASPGKLFSAHTDAAFEPARAGATARYAVLQLQLDRTTPLPLGTWASGLTAQWANANLLGSEQLAAGGSGTVRGFREGATFGDGGWVWRNDWRLPAWQPIEGSALSVEAGLFIDAARLRVHQPLAGERSHRRLASAGLAVQAGLPRGLSVALSWGRRLRSDVVSQARGGDHGHFSLSGYWAF